MLQHVCPQQRMPSQSLLNAETCAGDDALPEALQGTTLLAGFLSMLVLDVLHKMSAEVVHPHERETSSEYQAVNGDVEHQQNGHLDSHSSSISSSNSIAAIIVRLLHLCS